jgi:thiosulfate/3-mercaptopyruvate sulfurtransferase
MESYTTLIDADALAAIPEPSNWVLLDCRFDLARPAWGEQAFLEGHLPGAQYAHLDRDLSGPVGPSTGRHPLPAPGLLAERARAWGISGDTQVVAYDQGNGMYAARAWWLLRWLGHERVAVLDGGVAAWTAAGGELTREIVTRPHGQFVARPDASCVVDADFLLGALGAAAIRLSDARAADRFAGRNETIDPVAGHVPGAQNHPFARNLDERGRFLPAGELRRLWLETLGDRQPGEHVAMCGSGISACHNLLALEHAGLHGSRLYAGSWSEWIRESSRPVATGPA